VCAADSIMYSVSLYLIRVSQAEVNPIYIMYILHTELGGGGRGAWIKKVGNVDQVHTHFSITI
jgi:hypothetical protein